MIEITWTVDHPEQRVVNEEVRARHTASLLASVNPRVGAQPRLRATLAGLSFAAETYYPAGRVGTLSKGAGAFGVDKNHDLVAGVSIPAVAAAYPDIRQLQKTIHEEGAER